MKNKTEREHYGNLDGIRTLAAVFIILMHIMSNTSYALNGGIFRLISKAGLLVQLFFMISGFGMCCGYYEKIKDNSISIERFYSKRYAKILPYFALLVLIDVGITFLTEGISAPPLIEGFSDLTLLYGMFPNSDITVIGVGWALGVIFAFYLLFPFFVYMLWNKRRAWLWMLISIAVNYVCTYYFKNGEAAVGCNIARWMCYFTAGGMLYLYRGQIKAFAEAHKFILLGAAALITLLCGGVPHTILGADILTIKLLLMYASWLACAMSINCAVLNNRAMKFMSTVSFEIYLAHMMIFRVIEKLRLLHITKNDYIDYAIVSVAVVAGVSVFAVAAKWLIGQGERIINRRRNNG